MQLFLITALATCILAAQIPLVPLIMPGRGLQVISGEYVVILKTPEGIAEQDAYPELVALHLQQVFRDGFAAEEAILHRYNLGYAAALTGEQVQRVRQMTDVDFVEMNQVVHIQDGVEWSGVNRNDSSVVVEQQHPLNWGLKRISQRDLPLRDVYTYVNSSGREVNVFVIDNGVLIGHSEFEGRAVDGIVVPKREKRADGNHGTHVSSSIAGKTFGVAKNARIINVKVLTEQGGTLADVLQGIEWSVREHKRLVTRDGKAKSVANMSLGGGKSRAIEAAVNSAVKAGILFAVAAGNDNADACNYSPAGASAPITVGATDASDRRAYFSNHGRCVDIFAPGHKIAGAWNGNANDTITISGTSMASPHVCGVMALLLADADLTPMQLKDRVLELASRNKVGNAKRSSNNRLLFSNPTDSAAEQ